MENLIDVPLVQLLAGVAVVLVGFALGVRFYPTLKRERQGYPLEAQIEAALLPVIFQAICAAYRVSDLAVDELHRRIEGADKKGIADSVYAMLPDTIGGHDVTLVKKLVPPERFAQLVQDAFDRFDRFFLEHRGHFDGLFEEWKEANAEA